MKFGTEPLPGFSIHCIHVFVPSIAVVIFSFHDIRPFCLMHGLMSPPSQPYSLLSPTFDATYNVTTKPQLRASHSFFRSPSASYASLSSSQPTFRSVSRPTFDFAILSSFPLRNRIIDHPLPFLLLLLSSLHSSSRLLFSLLFLPTSHPHS